MLLHFSVAKEMKVDVTFEVSFTFRKEVFISVHTLKITFPHNFMKRQIYFYTDNIIFTSITVIKEYKFQIFLSKQII